MGRKTSSSRRRGGYATQPPARDIQGVGMRISSWWIVLAGMGMAYAAPATMHGVRVNADGSLSVAEMPVPHPGPGEVLIKVRAAGVNPVDWKAASGRVGQVPGTD